MANIYNGQLDAFDLYHQVRAEESRADSQSFFSPNGTALPALGHGLAGSAGAAISNIATYPLDLIITRLQIRRQLRKDQTTPGEDEYTGFEDAARKIYKNEHGLRGFYTGIWQDTGKTVADSFFFFLTYNFLRQRRIAARANPKVLPAIDELGVGFIAGSLTKLLTTPMANIVTRKQAAALMAAGSSSSQESKASSPSSSKIANDILREKGVVGFWSGYSASLVLTLNPSLTFFLFETLKRLLLPRSKRENPPATATFFLAAISKAIASSLTYPFSLAKARAQAGTRGGEVDENKVVRDDISGPRIRSAARSTIFSTVLTIARTEGALALYEGLDLVIVKAFFSHGITMLVKQAIHRAIIQTYYILSIVISRYKRRGGDPVRLAERAKQRSVEYYDLAIARATEKMEETKQQLKGSANETAEFVAEYVEEESDEWRSLYGTTGLAKWLENRD